MKDIDLIKEIKNIKIGNICKSNKVDYTNLIYERTTKENIKKIANELRRELYPILIDDLISVETKMELEGMYEKTDSL
jgi:hypothetical protein